MKPEEEAIVYESEEEFLEYNQGYRNENSRPYSGGAFFSQPQPCGLVYKGVVFQRMLFVESK